MIKITHLTVKNFMSVGNATQAIDFDRHDLTLVLGENLDLGSNGARNGTGKTTIINALSYALYGTALTNIKKDNLINKTNAKNMLVSVEFNYNGVEYRIERGRRPGVLKVYKDEVDINGDNDAQGDSRETQKEIDKLLNISHDMFKHTIALNTYTEPFLSMRTNDQKNIIEQLLGITVLTQKADMLKELLKNTKNNITEEEFRIKGIEEANKHITKQIASLETRRKLWLVKKEESIAHHTTQIEELLALDVEAEITAHKDLEEYIIDERIIAQCNKHIDGIETNRKKLERDLLGLEKDLELIVNHKCHACGQELHDENHEKNLKEKEDTMSRVALDILSGESQELEHIMKLSEMGDIGVRPITYYTTIKEAHGHKHKLATLTTVLEKELEEEDPYTEQIHDMENKAIQDISFDELNRITELRDHQEFLYKLLSSKDSFIRKKIINQNLSYLNNRLTYYLDEIGLPHRVRFQSDLTVEISDLGRDLDFDNLSRGERNRLILSLSFAFRDVWESLYSHINLMFIDELVDSGLDTNGVEAAIKIMKSMARDRSKSVWLVSHREELMSRVHNSMRVIKENGFTSYEGMVE